MEEQVVTRKQFLDSAVVLAKMILNGELDDNTTTTDVRKYVYKAKQTQAKEIK